MNNSYYCKITLHYTDYRILLHCYYYYSVCIAKNTTQIVKTNRVTKLKPN